MALPSPSIYVLVFFIFLSCDGMQIQSLYKVVSQSYCLRIEEVLKISRRMNELLEEDSS